MIDYNTIREAIVTGLKDYVGVPVVRSNQNGEPPDYPYLSYTITQLMSENKGTYGEYEDGKDRKSFNQTWSLTSLSDDDTVSALNAVKAREWLDHFGQTYLKDRDIVVKSVGAIFNRDNVITIEYEYRKGFDFVLTLFDVLDNPIEESGTIESISFEGNEIEMPPTNEELIERLDERLSGR